MPKTSTKKKTVISKRTIELKKASYRKSAAASRQQRVSSSAQIHQGVGVAAVEIEARALHGETFENDFVPGFRRR
jgi:hypothetical protein